MQHKTASVYVLYKYCTTCTFHACFLMKSNIWLQERVQWESPKPQRSCRMTESRKVTCYLRKTSSCPEAAATPVTHQYILSWKRRRGVSCLLFRCSLPSEGQAPDQKVFPCSSAGWRRGCYPKGPSLDGCTISGPSPLSTADPHPRLSEAHRNPRRRRAGTESRWCTSSDQRCRSTALWRRFLLQLYLEIKDHQLWERLDATWSTDALMHQVNSVFFTGSIKSDIHQNAIHIFF